MIQKFKIINLEQGSQEWLSYRKLHIGASDSPIICGKSPYKTAFQLYQEKIGDAEGVVTDAMRKGHEMEPHIRNTVSKLLGIYFEPMVCESIAYPWMSASLDGINHERNALLEIKFANRTDHTHLRDHKEIPHHYWIQMQHQFAVTGLSYGYYCSYHDGDVIYQNIQRDDAFIADLVQKTKEFYLNVMNLNPPPLSDKDFLEIEEEDFKELANTYLLKKIQMEALQKEIDDLRDKLTSSLTHPHVRIGNLKMTQYLASGRIDYGSVPELKGVDLEQYRKPGKLTWRLS